MKKIFGFTNKKEIYQKCLYASVAHAVMVGKYDLLLDEIAWDEKNYLFQDMEGLRAVIAFGENLFMCGVQNRESKPEQKEKLIDMYFGGNERENVQYAEDEIFPYFLEEIENEDGISISALFWGDDTVILSKMDEKDIIKISGGILLPYLYNFSDLKKYWRDYYEASDEQFELIENVYQERLTKGQFDLKEKQKEKLKLWYGDNINFCRQAFREIGITV
ncbi:MAG: hypothetical protein K6G64_08665 [Eubacterium sp.]|nr:hypothetical protein [Eubacterium sp.]